MNTVKKINDELSFKDSQKIKNPRMEDFMVPHKPFRTRITGFDEFGKVLFDFEQNLVVLGGAITTLEKLFNVRSPLTIDTINNINDIDPADQDPGILPQSLCVCLWGIGVGGCGDAFGSVRDVKFYEREIGQNHQSAEMLPFRVVSSEFTDENAETYYLKKTLSNGKTAYYAKVFDDEPFIRTLWKDGEEGEDGSEVTDGVHDTTRTDDIETFVEMHMTISKNDVREYFDMNGEIEKARVNTVGLFTAEPIIEEGVVVRYKNVKLFSKFNFDNEALGSSSRKELALRYRIYAS